MSFSELLTSLQDSLGETLPSLLVALAILLIGWLVAVVIRVALRRGLGVVNLNRYVQSSTGSPMDVEGGIAKGVYYVILLIVLGAFFSALNLTTVSGSLNVLVDQILAFAPRIAAAALLLLVAWLVAVVLRTVVTRALASTDIDERLSVEANMQPMSQNLGNVLYWLVFLLFLPAILGALEMEGMLQPVQSMVDSILSMLPNVLAAGVIGVVGWFVARILRDLVANLLAAAGADRVGERAGLAGTTTLSGLVGLIAYIFVLVPALIAALNALQIQAISEPATEMLAAFLAAIPNIFAAAIVLAVAWFVSGFIAGLTTSLLGGMGFDQLPQRLGLGEAVRSETSPSEWVGKLIVFFIMLFAVTEAAGQLGFDQVEALVATLITFGAHVLLGAIIIAVGFWISTLAGNAIARVSGPQSAPLANLARYAILGIVIAMGLRAMGLADDIVNLAFGLTLGAVAVAVALSFGLGGREAAGRQMEHWLARLRNEEPRDPRG